MCAALNRSKNYNLLPDLQGKKVTLINFKSWPGLLPSFSPNEILFTDLAISCGHVLYNARCAMK